MLSALRCVFSQQLRIMVGYVGCIPAAGYYLALIKAYRMLNICIVPVHILCTPMYSKLQPVAWP